MIRSLLSLFSMVSLFSAGLGYKAVADCGKGGTSFTLDAISFTPETPKSGDMTNLTIVYTIPPAHADVVDGQAVYSVSFNGIPFSPTTNKLCDDAPCPLVAGQHVQTTLTPWPSGVNGKVITTVQWYSGSSEYLLCFQATVKT